MSLNKCEAKNKFLQFRAELQHTKCGKEGVQQSKTTAAVNDYLSISPPNLVKENDGETFASFGRESSSMFKSCSTSI